MSSEKQIWLIVQDILHNHGDILPGISIHEDQWAEHEEEATIYTHQGNCWKISKVRICEPDEVNMYQDVDHDGYQYNFTEPYDGFTETGVEKAIQILGNYGKAE